MIEERTPGEKLAYADGFKQAIEWFESREIRLPRIIEEARALHTSMLAPNDHWCIGCSPDPDNTEDQPCCGCERPRPADGP